MNVSEVDSPKYERRIRASDSWWSIDWREIWQYRDLLVLLIQRDFNSRYAQSVLGPAWFVIQPLLTTFIFTIVFGNIARIPTGSAPPLLFYLCNLIAWNYFSSCFNSTSQTLTWNQHLFSKVYFPRLIAPVASLISNGITLLVQLLTFFAFFIYFKFAGYGSAFHLTSVALLSPLLMVQLAILAAGFGFWMSAVSAKYRDLAQLSGILVQLGMYATPIIYPLSAVPDKWRWLMELNPVTFIVEALRIAFLGVGTVTPFLAVSSLVITLLAFITGLAAFTKTERSFVDIV